MSELQARNLDSAEETHAFELGKTEIVTVAGTTVRRRTFQPGWRWADSLKKIEGTDSCQTHHVGYAISGHLHVRADDGAELEIRAGDAYNIPPGHEGWIIGQETFVSVEFPMAAESAKT